MHRCMSLGQEMQMSAPLIFVRDGRTLPFIPVTTAALGAIRDATVRSDAPARRPYVTATYLALLEFANEERADRVALAQRDLVERVGASRTTVQASLTVLREAEVLEVHERSHANGRLENEYVVVEPSDDSARNCTPARETSDPRSRGEQRTQEELQEDLSGERAREETKRKPVSYRGKAITDAVVQVAERLLVEFGAQTHREIGPRTGDGAASPALKQIVGAMLTRPEVTEEQWTAAIRKTVNSPPSWVDGRVLQLGDVFGERAAEWALAPAGRSATVGHATRSAQSDFSRFDRGLT